MSMTSRLVLPETLDELDPADPRARRSRRDLRRVHLVMRTVSILKTALKHLKLDPTPRRILELGGGDGSLTLRLARAMRPRWSDVVLTILDRHDIVSPQTLQAYETLGWRVRFIRRDAMNWAAEPALQHYDLCVASLFLHHFHDSELAVLLHAIAARSDAFVACEPRRGTLAALGSAMIGLLGANRITREDAVTSVAAGFTQRELSSLWPDGAGQWSCREYKALPFTHCFAAARDRLRTGAAAP